MKKHITLMVCSLLLLMAGCSDEGHEENGDEKAYENMTDVPYELGFDIVDELHATEEDGNIFISPASIYMTLGMLYQGADSETKSEIEHVLYMEDMDKEEMNQAVATLLAKLDEAGDDTNLQIANALWLDNHYQINASFKETLQNDYQSDVAAIDAQDPGSADLINNWVKEHTNNQIDEMVDSPLNEDFVSLVMNAVYFQGNWAFPFDEKLTEEEDFERANGETVQVPMMSLPNKELYYTKNDDYETVRLPYGEDEEMSMYLFLPGENSDMDDIFKDLSKNNIDDIKRELEQQEGTVKLPKFSLEEEIELNDLLKSLGMENAFDKEKADFSNIVEEEDQLWISEMKHKTFLDIDETGTEAAGATSAEIDTTSAPIEEPFIMEMDHPFLFMITDDRTNTMLFFGEIQDPLSDEA